MLVSATAVCAQQQIEEIVVTSQKRAENLQDIPMSVSVLGVEALDQRTIRDLEDISLATPGLRFDNTGAFGGATVAIRGISAGFGSATTNFYLDDMPLLQRGDDRTALIVPHVFDLERVEILRGPQGTLYGAGAMGGAIRYITPRPSLTEASMKASGEYGMTDGGEDAYQASLVGGIPLIDDALGFRGGVFYRDEGGWIDQADRFTGQITDRNVNDTETFAVRGSLLWEPTDKLSIAPSIQYQSGETGNRDLYWDLDPGFVNRDNIRTPQDTKFVLANVKAEYDFGRFIGTSITSWLDRSTDLINDWAETDADALGYDRSTDPDWVGADVWDVGSDSKTQEFRLSSADDGQKLMWQAGLYYQKNDYSVERWEYQNLDAWVASIRGITEQQVRDGGWVEKMLGGPHIPGPLSGTSTFGPDSNTVTYYQFAMRAETERAVFVNVDYQLTDRLSVGIGARKSKTKFENTEIQDGPWSGGFQQIDGSQNESPTIGKFNVEYEVTDDDMVYLTWSEGFRLGGANQDFSNNALCADDLAAVGGKNPVTFASDKLESLEIGTKSSLFDGSGSLMASVYRIDWSDIQRQVFLPSCLNGYTDNLGEAEVTGFDLEFAMQLNDSFRISMAWGRNTGQFSKDTVKFGRTYALEGQDFAQPKEVGNASLYYNGALNDREIYATFSVNYNGSYDRVVPVGVEGYAPNQEAIRDAESVTVAGLRAGMNFDSWNAGVFVENLFNSDDVVGQFLTAASRTDVTRRSLRPRVIGVSLDHNF